MGSSGYETLRGGRSYESQRRRRQMLDDNGITSAPRQPQSDPNGQEPLRPEAMNVTISRRKQRWATKKERQRREGVQRIVRLRERGNRRSERIVQPRLTLHKLPQTLKMYREANVSDEQRRKRHIHIRGDVWLEPPRPQRYITRGPSDGSDTCLACRPFQYGVSPFSSDDEGGKRLYRVWV